MIQVFPIALRKRRRKLICKVNERIDWLWCVCKVSLFIFSQGKTQNPDNQLFVFPALDIGFLFLVNHL